MRADAAVLDVDVEAERDAEFRSEVVLSGGDSRRLEVVLVDVPELDGLDGRLVSERLKVRPPGLREEYARLPEAVLARSRELVREG